MPKQVCLYARVSKTSQSVERQISELETVATRNDWEIVDRYIDHGISGAKGRKYMKGRFKKFILSVQDQDMPSQLASFDKEFNAWKGTQEQIDDVCVMGVRIT